MAGDVLNFDTLHGEVVTIAKTPPGEREPREFHLYDDIPAEVMLGAFGMQPLAQRMQDAVRSQDSDAFDEAWQTYQEAIAALCGEIFRHTYPAMDDDEIAQLFTHSERERIVQLFFGRRSAQLREQLPDTTPDMAGFPPSPPSLPDPAAAPSSAAETTPAARPFPMSMQQARPMTRAERRARARLRSHQMQRPA